MPVGKFQTPGGSTRQHGDPDPAESPLQATPPLSPTPGSQQAQARSLSTPAPLPQSALGIAGYKTFHKPRASHQRREHTADTGLKPAAHKCRQGDPPPALSSVPGAGATQRAVPAAAAWGRGGTSRHRAGNTASGGKGKEGLEIPRSFLLSSFCLLRGFVPYSRACASECTVCSSSSVAFRPRMHCSDRGRVARVSRRPWGLLLQRTTRGRSTTPRKLYAYTSTKLAGSCKTRSR